MAMQVLNNPADYNTIPYGKKLSDEGRPLPKYFFQPLFKHPPLFTFLATGAMKIFGTNIISAGYISLILGILMIPLIYLLGTLLIDKKAGILSAIFLWLDPIAILCSQKVWIDTTIAFFTLLAAVFFIWGLKKNNDWGFILSGLSSGLATNTKYTGILITFAIFLYALTYSKHLFKNKKFIISLFLPFLMLIPWIIWNLSIYKLEFFNNFAHGHHEIIRLWKHYAKYTLLVIPAFISCIIFYLFKKKQITKTKYIEKDTNNPIPNLLPIILNILIFCLFLWRINPAIFNSLSFTYFPTVSWSPGVITAGHAQLFYFEQLIEFFFIYLFGFLYLLSFHRDEQEGLPILRLFSFILLGFFLLWGNFQCRYILSCLAFILLFAAHFIIKTYDIIDNFENIIPRVLTKSFFLTLIIYGIIKVYYLNINLSFTNDCCYF